jgi:putative ABC transport system permease protein
MRSNIHENLMMALLTLRAHKLRSALTLVGIIIGVWTVMAIASIISGVDVAVKKEVESFGTRSIYIAPSVPPPGAGGLFREEGVREQLTADDATAIAGLPTVELAVPFLDVSFTYYGGPTSVVRGGKTAANVRVQGTLPEYEQAGIEWVSDGRFFTKYESDTNQEVCVIGEGVAESLFWPDSPVGKALRIGRREFRVIGVLEGREQFIGGDAGGDNLIYIPFGAALHLKPRGDGVFIMAVARHEMLGQAQDQITDLLRSRLGIPFDGPENFTLSTSDSIIEAFRSITSGVSTAMIVISSVALLVGGVGVMNIMLICVTERTREIGVRKALGARRRDILWQFLIEAMTLTGLGGLIGLSLGWLTTFVIRLALPSYVPYWAPLGGFLASVGIGLVFGLWPAWRAARLNPIESLRYE